MPKFMHDVITMDYRDNAAIAHILEKSTGLKMVNIEAFKADPAGHKFAPNQQARLTGLVDYPQHNGKIVTITSIRKDGPRGKAYYIEGDASMYDDFNWVYEYRLEPVGKEA